MKLTSPDTSWEYSSVSEIKRYVSTARLISKYFFQKKGFYVLPDNTPASSHTVFFPQLPITKDPCFWEYIGNTNKVISQLPNLSDDMFRQIEHELPLSPHPFNTKKEWRSIERKVWQELLHYFPTLPQLVKKVVIMPTLYGTIASGLAIENDVLRLYYRLDAPIAWIPGAIVISLLELTRENSQNGLPGINWEERQAIGDYLMSQTAMASIVPGYVSTINILRTEHDTVLHEKSDHYLNTLGYPTKQLLSIKNDAIHINEEPLVLRRTEHTVLSLLMSKRHAVVNHREIAYSLWGEATHEKFSLYAISKIIERIRMSIYQAGVHPGVIETRRGQGFVLND